LAQAQRLTNIYLRHLIVRIQLTGFDPCKLATDNAHAQLRDRSK